MVKKKIKTLLSFAISYLSLVASEESCIVPHTFEVADEVEICAGSTLRRTPARLVSMSTVGVTVLSIREDTPCCLLCRASRDDSLHNADPPWPRCPWRTLSSCHERSSFDRFTHNFDVPLLCPFDDTPPLAAITPRPATAGRLGVCNPGECTTPGVGPSELSQTRDTCSSRMLCALSSSLSVITDRRSIVVNGYPSTAVVFRAHALGIDERTDASSTWLASLSYNPKPKQRICTIRLLLAFVLSDYFFTG